IRGVLHHMVIGDDVSLAIDDKPRAQAPSPELPLGIFTTEEAFEKLFERIAFAKGIGEGHAWCRAPLALHDLGRTHVDHRGLEVLSHVREIRHLDYGDLGGGRLRPERYVPCSQGLADHQPDTDAKAEHTEYNRQRAQLNRPTHGCLLILIFFEAQRSL